MNDDDKAYNVATFMLKATAEAHADGKWLPQKSLAWFATTELDIKVSVAYIGKVQRFLEHFDLLIYRKYESTRGGIIAADNCSRADCVDIAKSYFGSAAGIISSTNFVGEVVRALADYQKGKEPVYNVPASIASRFKLYGEQ